MKTGNVKAVLINIAEPEKGEQEAAELLSLGYKIQGNPTTDAGHVVLVLVQPPEKEYVSLDTAYPTEKQVSYLCWAYVSAAHEVKDLKITKAEASKLIEMHKDQGDGNPFCGQYLPDSIETIRQKSLPVGIDVDKEKYDEIAPF